MRNSFLTQKLELGCTNLQREVLTDKDTPPPPAVCPESLVPGHRLSLVPHSPSPHGWALLFWPAALGLGRLRALAAGSEGAAMPRRRSITKDLGAARREGLRVYAMAGSHP